jgi:hypothetical protein
VDAVTKILNGLSDFRVRVEPFKFHILALAAAIGLGVFVGLIKVNRVPPKSPDADRWNLPKWAPFQAAPSREAMGKDPMFAQDPAKKKATAEAVAAAAAPAWRFTGTMADGNNQIALIEVDKGRRVKRIAPGDELPGGAKVTAVRVGTLVYTDSAGEQVLKLFSADVTPEKSKK